MLSIYQTMLAFLGPTFIMFIILGLILAVVALAFLGIRSKSSINLSVGPFKLVLGGKEPVNLASLISSILEHQEDNIRKMFQIENDIIKKQMNYTEQMLYQLKYIMSEMYSDLLIKKIAKTEDVKLHKDYRYQQRILNILIKEMKDSLFYEAFLDNHLEAITGADWDRYIDDKSTYALNYIRDFLDSYSENGTILTRKEVSDSEKNIIPKIKDVIKLIFEKAKDISVSGRQDIQLLRLESKDQVNHICKAVYGLDLKSYDKTEV